jgi:hypothetical protein
MDNEILNDVKMHIEGSTVDDHFDGVLIDYINTTFMVLYQMGVGDQTKPFKISLNQKVKWTDFLDDNSLEGVKEYMYRRVQMMFDPPTSSNALEASKDILSEMEWRINAYADYKDSF